MENDYGACLQVSKHTEIRTDLMRHTQDSVDVHNVFGAHGNTTDLHTWANRASEDFSLSSASRARVSHEATALWSDALC